MGAFRQLGEDGALGGGVRGGEHDGAHDGGHDEVRDGDLDGHRWARGDDRRGRVDHEQHGELRGEYCELEVQLHVRVEYVENDWVDKLEKKNYIYFSEDEYGLG